MPKPIKNSKLALIGLIILFAISIVMGGGRIPKIEQVRTTMRTLSGNETKELVNRIPLILTDALGEVAQNFNTDELQNDTNFLKVNLEPKELHNSLLQQVFPNAHFYQIWKLDNTPHYPYLIAIIGNKLYHTPYDFNRLLAGHNLEVNDKNIIELAKAFIIFALEGKEITFLEGKRSVDKKKTPPIYRVHLKVKVNDVIQIYGVNIQNGQIQWATMNIEGKTATKYFDLEIIENPPKRGELDLNGQLDIATTTPSKAYVELEGSIPHYYLRVESNGQATNDTVKFNLSGFQSNQPNIAILVRCIEPAYTDTLLFQLIVIDGSGNSSFLWTPNSQKTCITRVWAIDTMTKDTTRSKELTLERVVSAKFHPPDVDSFTVYYTDQFFQGLVPKTVDHDPAVFAGYVKDAAIESWEKQVIDWSLANGLSDDKPEDADAHLQFFVIDTTNWYHGNRYQPPLGKRWYGWFTPFTGPNLKIWIRYDAWHHGIGEYYFSKGGLVKSIISHEFYHCIQYGHSSQKFTYNNWKWFTEGQARFMQSVQVPVEEFYDNRNLYPSSANEYLNSNLNTSLCSLNYSYCIYWRFLYERFDSTGTTAEKLSVIRDAYKQTKNVSSNPIVNGAEAINLAFAEARQHRGTVPFDSFSQSIDRFATDCYLKKFDSASIYVKPAAVLYEFSKIKEDSTDSILNRNSIDCSFGIDYFDFRTNSQGGNRVGKVKFSCIADNESLRLSSKLLLFKNTYVNNCSIINFIQDTIIKDCRGIDSMVVRIARLDAHEGLINPAYTLKAKYYPGALTDSTDVKDNIIKTRNDNGIPVFKKGYNQTFWINSIPVFFSKKEGKDDSLRTKLKIIKHKNDSVCYNESLTIFLRLDSIKKAIYLKSFMTPYADTYKIIAFHRLQTDNDKSNDTITGLFAVVDTGKPPPPPPIDSNLPLCEEEFDKWPTPYWIARHWSKLASCWHLRRGGEPPWGDTNHTNYMCLRWHNGGHCYETLYSPSIVCSNYDTIYLKFREHFKTRPTCQCTARLVYSTDGGNTWPFVLANYSTSAQIEDATQLYRLDSAAHKERVKVAWTYAGDSSDIESWCIDDVRFYSPIITALDIAPTEISWPFNKIVPGDSQSIWFLVKNIGAGTARDVIAEAQIGDKNAYTTISQLPPMSETLVRLNIPTPGEGSYLMKVITKIDNYPDDCPLNDTLCDSLIVTDSFWEPVCQYPLGRTKPSASLATTKNTGEIYFWGGRRIQLCYQYFPRSNQWDTIACLPEKVNKGFLVPVGDTWLYFIPKRHKLMCKLRLTDDDTIANPWDTTLGRIGKRIRNPSACWDGGNYIYCLRGSNTGGIYKYSLSANDWGEIPNLPYGYKIKRRGGITSSGRYVYVMGIKDHMEKLLQYDTVSTSWDSLKGLPASSSDDKIREIFYADNRIYAFRDYAEGDSGKIWYYDLNDSAWILASPTLPNWQPLNRTKKIRTGACFTIWQDDKNHYGFAFSGRERRLLKHYPKPVPYTDDFLSLNKLHLPFNDIDLTQQNYPCDHFFPKFGPTGDTIICFFEDTTDDFSRICKMDTIILEDHLTEGEHNYEYPSYTQGGNALIVLKDNIVTRMTSDGAQETEISTGLCDDPAVSDEDVVYTKWENGIHRLYIVPIAGGDEVALTGTDYNCSSPQFSPNGNKIVYEKTVNGFSHIFLYNLQSQEETELLGGDCNHFNPRYSSDGRLIVCERLTEDGTQICKIADDGEEFEALTASGEDFEYPSFTPDSDYVICVKWCGDGSAICKVAVDDGEVTPLTDSTSIKLYPEVSPDGKKVAYELSGESNDGEEINRIGILRLPATNIDNVVNKPMVFSLFQNRPNPFHNMTKIKYGLPKTSKVKLLVYNITGRAVTKLVDGEQKEGYYDITWNGRDNRGRKLPSGVYFYRLDTENVNLIKKVVMTK